MSKVAERSEMVGHHPEWWNVSLFVEKGGGVGERKGREGRGGGYGGEIGGGGREGGERGGKGGRADSVAGLQQSHHQMDDA